MGPDEVEARLRKQVGKPQLLHQRDIFFQVPRGRLKLRMIKGQEAQLIFYERPDLASPKTSRYSILPLQDPEKTLAFLQHFLKILGEVRKKRLVFLSGQTRIHLDHVQGLGHFLEIEVVLRPQQTEEEGRDILNQWATWLGIRNGDIVAGAYIDLLLQQSRGRSPHR